MFGRAAIWGGWVAAICVACGAVERDPSEGEGGTSHTGGVPTGGTGGGVTSEGGTQTNGGTTAPGGSVSVATGGVSAGGASSSGAGPATGGVTGTAGKAAAGGATSGGVSGCVSAGAGGEAGAPGLCDDYVACGCGCSGAGPAEVGRCYYPEAGDLLSDIIAADRSVAANPNCASAGCSSGLRHACCLRGGSEPAGNATYSAVRRGANEVNIQKTGNDGRCGRLSFVVPGGEGGVYTALTLPTLTSEVNTTATFGLAGAYELACSTRERNGSAIGAIGSMRLRPAITGEGCVLDVHITTFFARDGSALPLHFDADGLELIGAGSYWCP